MQGWTRFDGGRREQALAEISFFAMYMHEIGSGSGHEKLTNQLIDRADSSGRHVQFAGISL
jgi:antirestriction protein ArdC